MPTIRSEFSFAQFRERLQNYAYKLACDVISDPAKHGRIRITMTGPIMNEIETKEFKIRFFASHASFDRLEQKKSKFRTDEDYLYTVPAWGFNIEEKEYMDSNHRSKISYYGDDMTKMVYANKDDYRGHTVVNVKKSAEVKQTVFDFISKLMEGVKAEPRFSLAKQIVAHQK
jgi:hypothetical protein